MIFLILFLICYFIQLLSPHVILWAENFMESHDIIPTKKIYFLNLIPFYWVWTFFKNFVNVIKELD
jgi:hypothetical protein